MASKRKGKGSREPNHVRPARAEIDPAPGLAEGQSLRTHETLGILVLASALLVGPSLASVQFGRGDLMGPLGQLVGTLMHWALGLTGHILVLAMLGIAIRIFARAMGRRSARSPWVLWRQRAGLVLLLLPTAMLAHLIANPRRLARASYGGKLGESMVDLLSSALSRPGTWVIAIAGFALSLVIATDFSWVWTAIRLARGLRDVLSQALSALGRVPTRIQALGQWAGQQLAATSRRRELSSATGGAAVLPPVLRVDLSATSAGPAPKRTRTARPGPSSQRKASAKAGLNDAVPELAASLLEPLQAAARSPEKGGEPSPSGEAIAHEQPSSASSAAPAPRADRSGAESEPQTLTIVQSSYRKRTAELREDTPVCLDEEAASGAESGGFVLHHETYRPPPIGLLELHGEEQQVIDEVAIQAQAERLTRTLADYKIFGKVTEVHPGPVVTMYEFVPAPGTRVSKVASLSDDLAMSLHAERVRIVAPIPGKGAIGIEVPNAEREVVSFKEIVADDTFRQGKGKLKLALGKSIVGAPVVMDLAKMPHLLVAGATGAGKSVGINAMICSLLMRYTPEEVRLILIDPKFLELSGYNDIPHLLLPVVTDPKQAAVALRWAVAEMERRYQLLADVRVRDISSFNRKVARQRTDGSAPSEEETSEGITSDASLTEAKPAQLTLLSTSADGLVEQVCQDLEDSVEAQLEDATEPHEGAGARPQLKRKRGKNDKELARLPYLVVVIDEFADLMMVASKEVETSVARLAQKARACGIHLIVATQRPSVDVITGLVKANFPSRIAFQVASTHDSKTILGSYGAENLLGSGDMLVLDRGAEMKRVHGAYISDDEIRRIIEWLCEQGRPVYDMDILKSDDEDEQQEGRAEEPNDPLYDEAVALVAESQQASISMVQRRLRIGYNRAARLIEQMEREGIVGPPDGVRGREVLVQHHG